jgi:type II secretory ATPase GspE/PulE/Tfp pilus assembly ATPase PilB-like protein
MNRNGPKNVGAVAGGDPSDVVDRLLAEAVSRGASDMYWLPSREGYQVRCRVDGREVNLAELPSAVATTCVTRLKVLSGLLTYRTKIAQDGVIRNAPGCDGAELRVAAMPSIHGERVTVRILNAAAAPRQLDDLGFPEAAIAEIRAMLQPANGLILLTGPTGCGKTTTIYAMLRELLRADQDPASIITIEDPVEVELPGVTQVSLTRAGEDWDYPDALKSALRQDVKTLVVGEIRNLAVARIVLDAALSGHRVITTLHAGDIAGVYARLLHQGLEPFLVAHQITGVVAQRLLVRADGTGRIPVVATLRPDDAWRDLVAIKPSLGALRKAAEKIPGASLVAAADRLVQQGILSEGTRHGM